MEDRQLPVIALVEDEEMDVRHFRRLAQRFELINEIRVFENGEDALVYLKNRRDDDNRRVLVLTDINMPRMTGHELIDAIRADSALASTVIFVVSTSDLKTDVDQAYAKNVAGYIVKDNSGTAFAESVQMLKHYTAAVTLIN